MSTPGIEQLVGERFKLADSRELEAGFRLLDLAQELCDVGLIQPDDPGAGSPQRSWRGSRTERLHDDEEG